MLFQTKSRGGLRTVGNVLTRSSKLIGSGGVFAMSNVAAAIFQELFTDATNDTNFTNTRATPQYVETDTGAMYPVPAGAIPIKNARPVRNLATSSDTPSTQNITVVVGRIYAVRIGAESASGATAVCSGAFTGTLTGDAADPYALNGVAVTTTLTVTITGSISKLQVQDITHRAFDNLGADVVTDGDFSADTWTKGTGWTVTGGKAVATAVAPNQAIRKNDTTFGAGALFLVQYEVSGYTSGSVRFRLYDGGSAAASGATVSADGFYSEVVTAVTSGDGYGFAAVSTFTGSIDNVTVRPLADADLVPDEYVDSATDHGTGVNGFRYFTTALANTVDGSGVVTEATGAALSGIALAMVPGATNLETQSSGTTALQNAAAVADGASIVAGQNRIKITATSSYAILYSTPTLADSTDYCVWRYIEAGTTDWAFIRTRAKDGSQIRTCFDVTNGTIGTVNHASAGMIEVSTGVYLCWVVFNTSTGGTAPLVACGPAIGDGNFATSTETIYSHHRQTEAGTLPTSPIVTSGSTASTDDPVVDFSGVTGFDADNETRVIATGLNASLEPDPTDTTERTIDVDDWDGTNLADIAPHCNVKSVTGYAPGERP